MMIGRLEESWSCIDLLIFIISCFFLLSAFMTTKHACKLREFVAHASIVNCLKIGKKSSRVLVTGGDDHKVNLWAIGEPNAIVGSLQTYCQKKGKEMIFFKFVSKRGSHANLQVVPLPSGKASVMKNIFNLASKKLGFEFKTINADSFKEENH